jgi:DNA-binding GntR family transcriptional regulator
VPELPSDQLKGASLSDLARDRLRAAIIEGRLKPGEKINIERIADNFGISRTPVREALKALEMDGMVRIEPHRGAVVEPFAWREIGHLYAMRSMLEGYAAELACQKQDAALVSALTRNCARARKQDRTDTVGIHEITELHNEFHRLIWLASGSPTLIRFLTSLQLPRSFNDTFWIDGEFRATVCNHHEEIAAAIAEGDADKAKELMEHHMLAASDMVAAAAKADQHNSEDRSISTLC